MSRKQFHLAQKAGEVDVIFSNPLIPDPNGGESKRLIPDEGEEITYVARRANTRQGEEIAEEVAQLGDAPPRFDGPDADAAETFWSTEHDPETVIPEFRIRTNPEYLKHQNKIAVINLTRLCRDSQGRPPSEELIRENFELRLFNELLAELNPPPEEAASVGKTPSSETE